MCWESRTIAKEGDVEPRKAMQRQPAAVQCFREARVADAEGQKADAGPPEANTGLLRLTQGQRWAGRD